MFLKFKNNLKNLDKQLISRASPSEPIPWTLTIEFFPHPIPHSPSFFFTNQTKKRRNFYGKIFYYLLGNKEFIITDIGLPQMARN